MTPQEFKARWQEIADERNNADFRAVEVAKTELLEVSVGDKQLLSQCGLPSETCTFRLDMFPPLRRVYKIFGPGSWSDKEKETVADCWALGEDGGGNAICFTEPKGEVWLLDHETFFQKREFINSSLSTFADFLLLDLEGWVGTLTYRQCFERMEQIDLAAMQSQTSNGAKTYWRLMMLEQIEEEEE